MVLRVVVEARGNRGRATVEIGEGSGGESTWIWVMNLVLGQGKNSFCYKISYIPFCLCWVAFFL